MTGYTRRNFRAVVDALVPRTPELASTHGVEYVAGGRDVELESFVIDSFNEYQEHHHGRVSTVLRFLGIRNYPYAVVVALLLDMVAIELLVRRDNRERVDQSKLLRAAPFAGLAGRDRLRAIQLLEDGFFGVLADRFGEHFPHLGTVRFLAMGLNTFPLLGYYSEWATDDEGERQGWVQTGYPGPTAGFAAHRGYELEAFHE